MKRIDKMTKDELFNSIKQGEFCTRNGICTQKCTDCLIAYYDKPITIRISQINTEEQLKAAYTEIHAHCLRNMCTDCKYHKYQTNNGRGEIYCFIQYLLEEIDSNKGD